jgi:nucleoside-diphosphate-sugar epimerase
MSSIASMLSYDKPSDHVFTENDWCEDATPKNNPYGLGKTLSEKLARELAQPDSNSGAHGFRLASINPGYVLGPLLSKGHSRTSPSIIRDIVRRTFPGCPPLNFNIVDVRDVATASVTALERSDLAGRYPLVEGRYWWHDMAGFLKQRYPERRISTWKLPSALIYVNALFDPRVSLRFLRRHLHRLSIVPGDAAAKALGLSYIGFDQMLTDTVQSLIDVGAA